MNTYPYFFEWATGQSHPTDHPTPERVIYMSDDREEYELQFAALLAMADDKKNTPAWDLIEQRADYYFWKYTDSEDRPVYNVTTKNEPPTTDGGYYSYVYLLKVKGLLAGPTVGSIIQAAIDNRPPCNL